MLSIVVLETLASFM